MSLWYEIAALKGKVIKLQNKGPDLILEGQFSIELKGATDLNPAWIANGAIKYNCPCLFLGDGENPERIAVLKKYQGIKLLGYEVFSDGNAEWIIGIVKPN